MIGMNMVKRLKVVPAVCIAFLLAGAAVDIAGASGGHAGPLAFPGFWSLFGLVGCLFLAGACKLAAHVLKRPETYYDDDL